MAHDQAEWLALMLLADQVACFSHRGGPSWRRESVHGEEWYLLPQAGGGLPAVLDELSLRFNRSDRLAGFEVHLLVSQGALSRVTDVGRDLAAVGCQRWQVLRWEPLRDRAGMLAGTLAEEPLPAVGWLQAHLLPLLESTFHYRDEAGAAERARAQRQHEDTLESLRAERLRLQADLNAMRDQLAALQRPGVEALLTYLPAIYRQVFGVISASDLALLGGEMSVPQIASPWPEPSADTLLTLQRQIHRLPTQERDRLREFCLRLPHKLEVRPEMRAWLRSE